MSGFITMHRDALDHPMLQDGDRFRAWFWLIANAAWKQTSVRVKGETVTIERGELSFSQRFLADKWGWSKSRVDRFIADLRAEGMISTRSKNGADSGATSGHNAGQGQCIITICNYSVYQDQQQEQRGNVGATRGATSGATAGQQRGKEEQRNKETRVEANASTPARAANGNPLLDHPLPEWLPREAWLKWIRYRHQKKRQITLEGAQGQIDTLTALHAAGYDPVAVINQSVNQSWTGLFKIDEEKDNAQPTSRPAPNRATSDIAREVAERLERKAQPDRGGGTVVHLPRPRSSGWPD